MIDTTILKSEEKAIFSLRSLYSKYGYLPYKMSKFEEYELYLRNKDFLVSDRIITFNDTNGKLMALKPDVTLSIIKNGEDIDGFKQKLCYNENVYRVSGSTHQYKEIMQTGLECIGDIDEYDAFEVITLAAKSLSLISGEYVLDISHLGILNSVLDKINPDAAFKREAAHYIAEKNTHDLVRICTENGVSSDNAELLANIAGAYGSLGFIIELLEPICVSDDAVSALDEIKSLKDYIKGTEFENKIFFDFSIVNDMNYYNGIVFKGYLNGICEGVLAGGRYDKLMQKMGRSSGAIGFAIYLDLLEELKDSDSGYDVDVLAIYDSKTDVKMLSDTTDKLISLGKSVSAQKCIPEKIRYKEVLDLRGENRD